MTAPIPIRFTAGAFSVDASLSIDLGGGPPAPTPVTGVYTPVYTLPNQVQYNDTTKRCELKSAEAARIAYATNLPPTSVSLTDQGSRSANFAALATALNNAYAGTGPRRIRLAANVNWGEFHDCDRAPVGATEWVYLESFTVGAGTLRAAGERVDIADAPNMAKFGIRSYNTPAVKLGPNTRRLRLVGIDICIDPAELAAIKTGPYGLPSAGGGGSPFTYGMFGWDMNEITVVDGVANYARKTGTPTDVILDRCIIRGDDDVMVIRNVLAAINRFVITDCYLECAGAPFTGQDCQNVNVSSCAGDIILRNNTMACAWGEHFLAGGGPTYGSAFLPADMVLLDILFTFLPRWRPDQQNRWHKNMVEFKYGRRGLVEGCVVEHYYGYGRFGSQWAPIIVTTTDQFSNESFIETKDITIRLNLLRNTSGSFTVAGRSPNVGDHTATSRVEIAHNSALPWAQTPIVGDNYSRQVQFSSGPLETANTDPEWPHLRDLVFRYNTIWNADGPGLYNIGLWILYGAGPGQPARMIRHTISNNIFACANIPSAGWWWVADLGSGLREMPTGWNGLTKVSSEARGNVIAGVSDVASQLTASIGSTNRGAATLAGLGLNSTTLKVLPGSIAVNASTDGVNSGADYDFLAAVTARTLTGRT